jgi:hypothetical protein
VNDFGEDSFAVATCSGSTFIWGSFAESADGMKRAVRRSGRPPVSSTT